MASVSPTELAPRRAGLGARHGLRTRRLWRHIAILQTDPERFRRITRAHPAVQELQRAVDDGRRQRRPRPGFPPDEAAEHSALHSPNSM